MVIVKNKTESGSTNHHRHHPKVINVHRLVEFLSLNDDVTEVKCCPICLMPEFDRKWQNSYCCLCCDCWIDPKNILTYEKSAYLEILTTRPLDNDGKLKYGELVKVPTRSYRDLTMEEINVLDMII